MFRRLIQQNKKAPNLLAVKQVEDLEKELAIAKSLSSTEKLEIDNLERLIARWKVIAYGSDKNIVK